MSKKTKIWLFSGLGALAVLAIVLAIWQPWKKEETEETPGTGQVVDQDETKPEEKGLVLKVGNEEIPAVRYTGDGWSILVPETWKQETVEESAIFTQDSQRGGPQVLVSPGSGYFGTFMSLAPEEGENGPGLVIKCPGAGNKPGKLPGCAIRVVGPRGERGCLCDTFPSSRNT